MVNKCVAAGCSNTNSDTVSLHKFPKDPTLRSQWEKQVQRTRAKWTATDSSLLCSEHFTADCFEADTKLAAEFGLSKRKRLKSGVVPSIFERHSKAIGKKRSFVTTCTSSDTSRSKIRRTAVEKRERQRVSN